MGNSIADYKSKAPRITGVTTINHDLRVKMGLGPAEYILMDAIVNALKKGDDITDLTMFQKTGFIAETATKILTHLQLKGFIFPEEDARHNPIVSPKWASFFTDIENEFEDFWTKDGEVCWQGSKIKGKSLYINQRKRHAKDYLIQQRDFYFKYLELLLTSQGFARAKMQATRFLGPQEDFTQDWAKYCRDEEEKIKKSGETGEADDGDMSPSTTTKEDRMKKLEE